MPQASTLSDAAINLLKRHGERDHIRVDDSNRETHRELAKEGLMVAVHSFTEGREVFYRLTKMGRKLACVLERISGPSHEESASLRP